VRVEKGQIHCGQYRQQIFVRIDDGKVRSFNCTGAANGSSTVVWLDGAGVKSRRAAKRIEMEIPFFQRPSQVVTFR